MTNSIFRTVDSVTSSIWDSHVQLSEKQQPKIASKDHRTPFYRKDNIPFWTESVSCCHDLPAVCYRYQRQWLHDSEQPFKSNRLKNRIYSSNCRYSRKEKSLISYIACRRERYPSLDSICNMDVPVFQFQEVVRQVLNQGLPMFVVVNIIKEYMSQNA